ncbi:hypothetical protein V8C86DRAFT_2707506 [Haematococcus lacustris]
MWARSSAATHLPLLRPRGGVKTSAACGPAVDWPRTLLLACVPSVGTFLFGWDLGQGPALLLQLCSEDMSGTTWWDMGRPVQLLIHNGAILGALATSLALMACGNRWGRRSELVSSAVLYTASSVASAAAGAAWWLAGCRLLYGLAVGLALHAVPVYIAETVPAGVRGALICLKEAALVAGLLAGFLLGLGCSLRPGSWRLALLLPALPACLMGLGCAWLPESPRWLLLNSWQEGVMKVWLESAGGVPVQLTPGYQAAWAALLRARGAGDPQGGPARIQLLAAELSAVAVSVREASMAGSTPLRLLAAPLYQRPLLAGLMLMLLQQVTGQPAVMGYAAGIFRAVGFTQGREQLVSVVRLVMTLVAAANVDVWGRRPLLLCGASCMGLSLLALAAAQLPQAQVWAGGQLELGLASCAALLLYIAGFQVSFGPLAWVASGEMFPLAVRGAAVAAVNVAGTSASLMVQALLTPLTYSVGSLATYATFACISLGAVGLVYCLVPELRGKTLEQVETTWAPLPSMTAGGAGEWQSSARSPLLNSVTEMSDEGESICSESSLQLGWPLSMTVTQE